MITLFAIIEEVNLNYIFAEPESTVPIVTGRISNAVVKGMALTLVADVKILNPPAIISCDCVIVLSPILSLSIAVPEPHSIINKLFYENK